MTHRSGTAASLVSLFALLGIILLLLFLTRVDLESCSVLKGLSINKAAAGLRSAEVRKRFAEVVKRISGPLITMSGEKVTGLEIGDPKDPPGGPITVRIAAVHTLSCGCCEGSVEDTDFTNEDLELALAADNIGHLTVNRTRVSDRGLLTISRHENLTYLDLSQNRLTDAALEHVGKLKKLKVLRLDNTSITGVGLRHLARLQNLEELSLADSPLQDAAMRHLSSLRGLRKLTLEKTPISGAGFAQVAGLNQLEEVSLSQAKCSDQGLSHLPEFPALKRIDLSETGAGNATLKALSKCGNLEEITLRGTSVSDEGLAYLSAMPHLRSLNLVRTAVSDNGLTHLGTTTTLEELLFARSAVRGPGICHLRNCVNLRDLNASTDPLDAIEADQQTLTALARFPHLRFLNICIKERAKPATFELRDMHDLQRLMITCDEPVDRIELSGMPHLISLAIRYPGQPMDEWHGKCEPEKKTPTIGRIAISNVGGTEPDRPLVLRLVMPDELDLRGIGKVNSLNVWGNIQSRHADELADLSSPWRASLNCAPGSDPASVGRILTAARADPAEAHTLNLAVDDWNEAWSAAMREVHSRFRYVTVRFGSVHGDASISLGGFAMLEELTLSGFATEKLTVENVNPQARELQLDDVSVGELQLLECCVPIACRKVQRLDRLVIDGIPPGKKYVEIFHDPGSPSGPILSPTVLKLCNVRDAHVCYLRYGQRLERVEVYGKARDFGSFHDVPDSVQEMTWEGRAPGRWMGDFKRAPR